MNPVMLAAIGLALIALVALCFGAGDHWFFGLLALASLTGGNAEIYQDHQLSALGLLLLGTLLAGISLRAVFAARRARQDDA
ncbi:hypothetical protein ACFYRN_25160 [Streptomyces sp. NPDC005227]|uniref:hypothetical protein n=1 Tax=Streptomyces sp. NPDC005227 TaxID=3364707 RepID=UPI00367BF05E